jgi:hypothetical protein
MGRLYAGGGRSGYWIKQGSRYTETSENEIRLPALLPDIKGMSFNLKVGLGEERVLLGSFLIYYYRVGVINDSCDRYFGKVCWEIKIPVVLKHELGLFYFSIPLIITIVQL